jgi:ribonuclease BN (tRNA processing enzyme)
VDERSAGKLCCVLWSVGISCAGWCKIYCVPYSQRLLINYLFYTCKHTRYSMVVTLSDLCCSGGRDIYPNAEGYYELVSESGMTVTAAPMQHTIPCVGYVTTEHDRAGHLDLSSVLPHIEVSVLG